MDGRPRRGSELLDRSFGITLAIIGNRFFESFTGQPVTPPRWRVVGLSFKCDRTGNNQLYLSTCADAAPQFELAANAFGAFPHTDQPPVSLAPCSQHDRVDPATIVTHHDAKIIAGIVHFHLHSACARMAKGVYQSLTADAVDLVADEGTQRTGSALGNDPVSDFLTDAEFLPHTRECLLETQIVC